MATLDSKITLSPVTPSDWLEIARLEAATFADDEFSDVAFGRERSSDAAIVAREAGLAAGPKPGQKQRNMKAVAVGPEGEEIVGFAAWTFCAPREEMRSLETEGEPIGKEKEGEGDNLGSGGYSQFFKDSILKGDEHMDRATEGRDYAKLGNLIVSPKYQRRGIGTILLEDGLREADAQGLQAVLGASPDGIGLYRKYGFVDFEVTDFNLWEYEGGEGMGVSRHVIMHRPATSSQNTSDR